MNGLIHQLVKDTLCYLLLLSVITVYLYLCKLRFVWRFIGMSWFVDDPKKCSIWISRRSRGFIHCGFSVIVFIL